MQHPYQGSANISLHMPTNDCSVKTHKLRSKKRALLLESAHDARRTAAESHSTPVGTSRVLDGESPAESQPAQTRTLHSTKQGTPCSLPSCPRICNLVLFLFQQRLTTWFLEGFLMQSFVFLRTQLCVTDD